MKKSFHLLPVGIFLLCHPARARRANIDSLELVAQISQDQLKLGKLQNMVDQRASNKQTAAVDAQNSANDNVRAAERLNADPNNKKLASDANRKAGDAKSDAGKSRKEFRKFDDLNKIIAGLKGKIAVAQAKLSVFSPTPDVTPIPIPVLQRDTTQHQ